MRKSNPPSRSYAGYCSNNSTRNSVERGQHDVNQGRTRGPSVRESRFQQARSEGHGGILLRGSAHGARERQGSEALRLRQFPAARQTAASRQEPQDGGRDSDHGAPRRDVPRVAEAEGDGGE